MTLLSSIWQWFKNGVWYEARRFRVVLHLPPVSAAVNHLQNIDNQHSSRVQGLSNKTAVLSQGEPRDAAVNFDTYRILQRDCAVSMPRHAFLLGLLIVCRLQ